MALKVKAGGEVGYLDCGDIVELAAHFDIDPFRRSHVETKGLQMSVEAYSTTVSLQR